MRRPGTRYIATEKSSAVKGRLKRFQFSTTQAYIVEMGEQAFRFYKDQGQITVVGSAAAITNGDFPSDITSWTDRSTGSGSISHAGTNLRMRLTPGGTGGTDIGWAEQVVTNTVAGEHVLKFEVNGAPSDRVELRIGTAATGTQLVDDVEFEVGYHCYSFTTTAADFYVQFRNRGDFRNKVVQIDNVSLVPAAGAVEVQTPYTEAQLFTVNGPQSADVLYLFHGSHPVYKLTRLGHSSWSLIEAAFEDGPWGPNNSGLTSTTITAAAATGLGINFTASSIVGINDDTGFQSTDVGRLIRLSEDSTINWGWGVIAEVSSTTVAVVDIRRNMVVTTAEVSWRLGEWSATTGYPSTGQFYQQRLIGANTSDQPQTWWASNTGDFLVHSPDSPNGVNWDGTVEDDDSLDYTISAANANGIRWMSPGSNTLMFGTQGGEWTADSTGAVITPTDVNVNPATSHGVKDVEPLQVDNVALFVQRAGRKVREIGFNFESDGFKAFDMTRLAEHVTRGGIVEMDFAEEPDSLVWAVRNDGQLLSMTFRREEDVVGWARHIIGGSFSTGDAVVESVAVIPGAAGSGQTQSSLSRDEVWVTVKRTINSATARYVEMFETSWDDSYAQEDAYYSDSLITYDSTTATVLTGYDHLEGETLAVFADGAVQASKTVASGGITIDITSLVVQAGLPYTHTMKTLKLIPGTQSGSPMGATKQIFGVTFVVMDAHTIGYGPSTSNLQNIDFRNVASAMDTGVAFFTGEYFAEWDDDWGTDPRMVIQSASPTPFTLLALVPRVDVKELY